MTKRRLLRTCFNNKEARNRRTKKLNPRRLDKPLPPAAKSGTTRKRKTRRRPSRPSLNSKTLQSPRTRRPRLSLMKRRPSSRTPKKSKRQNARKMRKNNKKSSAGQDSTKRVSKLSQWSPPQQPSHWHPNLPPTPRLLA